MKVYEYIVTSTGKEEILIRCKDCKHWKYEDSGTDGTVQGECDLMCIFSDGMFFCAGAEREQE